MSKETIKAAILKAADNPQSGWLAENADHLAQKVAEALGLVLAEPVKPAPYIAKPIDKTDDLS